MYELSITKDIQYRCYNQRYFVLLVTVVSVAYVLSLFSGSHVASLICFVFFVFFWGGVWWLDSDIWLECDMESHV